MICTLRVHAYIIVLGVIMHLKLINELHLLITPVQISSYIEKLKLRTRVVR